MSVEFKAFITERKAARGGAGGAAGQGGAAPRRTEHRRPLAVSAARCAPRQARLLFVCSTGVNEDSQR